MDQGYLPPEDLMHGYLDGGIDPEQESALFEELGRNPDLRRRFNEQQNIRSSLKYYGGKLTVPAAATSAVFEKLGMATPVASVPTPIPPPANSAATVADSVMHSSLVRYGLTAALAVVVTLVTLLLMDDDTGGALTSTASDIVSKTPARTLDMDVPVDGTLQRVAGASETGITAAGSALADLHSSSADGAGFSDAPAAMVASDEGSNETVSLQELANAQANFGESDSFAAESLSKGALLAVSLPHLGAPHGSRSVPTVGDFQAADFPAVLLPDARRFKMRVNYIGGVSSPDATLNTDNPALSNSQSTENVSIDLMYALDEDWSLGLAYGHEQFGQVFRFRNEDNRLLEFRQNPIIDWVGVTGRYRHSDFSLFDATAPYAEVQLGYGTTDAFLGRISAGMSTRLFNLVELDAAWHYSELMYSIPGGRSSSLKRGFTLGFSYAVY